MKSSNSVSVAILLAIAVVIILVKYVLPKLISTTLGIFPMFVIVLFFIGLIMLLSQLLGKR